MERKSEVERDIAATQYVHINYINHKLFLNIPTVTYSSFSFSLILLQIREKNGNYARITERGETS